MLSAYEGQFKKTKIVLCPKTNVSESANCYLLGKSPGRKGWRRSRLWASAVGASAQTQLLWRPPRGQQALLPAPPVPSSPQRADFHFSPTLLSPREPNQRLIYSVAHYCPLLEVWLIPAFQSWAGPEQEKAPGERVNLSLVLPWA